MRQSFDPDTDIPNLQNKVILVTGGNSGLGEATIAHYAKHNPHRIYLAARSRSKALEALNRVKKTSPKANIEVLDLDLASFDSVKAAAARVNAESSRLDILQLNGGVCVVPWATTKEGYEIQNGTNYMGHALLTQLLMPKLLETSKMPGTDVRIVLMSSTGHKRYTLPKQIMDWNMLKSDMRDVAGFQLYDLSMLTKVLHGYALAKRYPQLTVASVHPGAVNTNVSSGQKSLSPLVSLLVKVAMSLLGASPAEGAKNQVWCSVANGVKSGSYYEPVGKLNMEAKFATDESLIEGLWEWTDCELQRYGGPGWMNAQ